MAIIDGKVPVAPSSAAPRQLIVKLRTSRGVANLLRGQLLADSFGIQGQPRPLLNEVERLSQRSKQVLDRYVTIDLPGDAEADAIAADIAKLPEVETAYVAGQPCPPPVQAADDPRSSNQGYLDAAPDGVDARWAWGFTDGSGIGFVDLERGWTLDHEDLIDAGITIISGVNQDFHGHGTAVLGEVVACDNTIGCIGIAPEATARVVSQWRTSTNYNTAAAILSAADNMNPGDVLLLEAQTVVGSSTYLPVEVETAVYDAIRQAVDDGIVVVEAGANGSNDLDAFTDAAGKHVLDRNSSDFKDSGAIMVGAGSSTAPHSRLNFSNFGSRIDCFAWGGNIDTCGDGWTGTATNLYTTGFGGTSGASPIVTGAAVLLQSWLKRIDGEPASPDDLRSILSDPTLNTPSANPADDEIGVMPNLRAIIEFQQRIRSFRKPERYASLVYILTGIIDDSPGLIWVPGKGPVPVDPGWGRTPLGRAQKDLIVGLAISELSQKIDDAQARKGVAGQALRTMQRSLAQIGRQMR